MTTNSAINFSDLDFASLKSSFVQFLKGQNQFKDYNFSGSNLSVLLDTLSFNTFMHAFIDNMVVNEMFLDSSQLRDSIVSHAKELNYTPRSYTSATAVVNVSVIPVGSPGQIIVPNGTVFNAQSNNVVYTFITDEDIIITPNNGVYQASNVSIYEGFIVTENFVIDSSIQNQQFILSNPQIDTSSLIINIQNSSTDTTNANYMLATSLFGFGPTSNIYFLEAATANTYKVSFGDGNIGNALLNGNIITAKYRVCNGDAPNNISSFTPASGANSSVFSVVVTTVSSAGGGAIAESNSSIKFYAPRVYQSQQRAVTSADFETLLFTNFPEIEALNVYGGETLTPPQFGKVMISASVAGLDGFSDAQGATYVNFLQSKNIVGVTPVMVQPDFIYLSINTNVEYNVNVTNLSPSDIASIVSNTIIHFNSTNLEDFDITFRSTKLFTAIDNADPSIVSTDTKFVEFIKVVPTLNTTGNFTLQFQNPIDSGEIPQVSSLPGVISAVYSTPFTWNGVTNAILQDDGFGDINIVTPATNPTAYKPYTLLQQIGTINYTNGIIKINNFNVTQFNGSEIRVYANIAKQNPSVTGNIILKISSDEIAVNVTAVRE